MSRAEKAAKKPRASSITLPAAKTNAERSVKNKSGMNVPNQTAVKSKSRPRHTVIHLTNFLDVYQASPDQRIRWIREGVPAIEIKSLTKRMEMPQDKIYRILNLSPATVNRKVLKQEDLSSEDGERVIGVAKLIGQVEKMLQESGDQSQMKGFDAPKWVARWLNEPLPAFGGQCPADYMDTMEGQRMVSNVLAMMQSGAYA